MPNQLDPEVVNLARAVRKVESGDNFGARGGSGEYGAYQYTPNTWAAQSRAAGVNVPLEQATKEDQNKVFYTWAKSKKDSGKNIGEIASMHNAGEGRPNAYLEGNQGVNKYGVAYDTGAYAKHVAEAYQQIKAMGASYQPPPDVRPIPTPAAEPEPAPKKDFLDRASGLFNTFFPAKNIGEAIGTGLAHLFAKPEEQQYIEPSHATLGGIAGDVAQNALYFAPIGRAAGLATKGIEAVAPRLAGGAVARVGGKIAAGAATGYGLDVANSASNDNFSLAPGLGTALGVAAPLAGPALRGAGNAAAHVAGVSTGVGADVIKAGFNAAKEGGEAAAAFKGALKKDINPETIVSDARSALGELKTNRSEAYNAGLEKVEKESFITKNGKTYVKKFDKELGKEVFVPTDLTTKGVKDVATRTLKAIGLEAKGRTIDFARRPSLDSRNIQKIHSFVYNWEDMTPKGLNQLRQEVAGFRKGGINLSPSESRFNTYVDKLTDNIRNYLGDRVPQIAEMNAAYTKASNLIDEIQAGLSLGKNAQSDTAFRKLTSVLRTNNEFRNAMLTQLESEVSRNLPEKIAGQQMSEILPRGLVRSIGGVGAGAGLITGVGILPMLKLAIFTSPRAVGEMLRALGFTTRKANLFGKALGAKGLIFPAVGAVNATDDN